MNLRSKVIRLAHSNPKLRSHLLPLLVKQGTGSPDAVYQQSLKDLATLSELSVNVQDVIDGFNLHYATGRKGGMDPTIKSEFEVLAKSRKGLELAQATEKTLKDLVELYPQDKKYAKTLGDATKMVVVLTKQVEASIRVVRTLSKKQTPKALLDMAKKVEPKLKAQLIDPSQMEVFFNQMEDGDGTSHNAIFRVIMDMPKANGGTYPEKVELWLREYSTTKPGVWLNIVKYGRLSGWKTATVDGAASLFRETVEGWENLKGEAEGRVSREQLAQDVKQALMSALNKLSRGVFERDDATVSSDLRRVEISYRSDLPKEGERSVGESRYEEMVGEVIDRTQTVVNASLASYMSGVAKVSIHDGEKGWIFITVTLK